MSWRELSRVEFVRLGALAGLAPVAAVLAGCGSEPSGDGGGNGGGGGEETASDTGRTRVEESTGQTRVEESAPETTSGEPGSGGGGYIARVSEVPPGSAARFRDGGEPAVLVRMAGGDFAAYSAVCTHQGCTVAYEASQVTLNCPCHGSVFDPSGGGAVLQGPAGAPLPGIPVEVRAGEVRRV